MKFMLKNKSK